MWQLSTTSADQLCFCCMMGHRWCCQLAQTCSISGRGTCSCFLPEVGDCQLASGRSSPTGCNLHVQRQVWQGSQWCSAVQLWHTARDAPYLQMVDLRRDFVGGSTLYLQQPVHVLWCFQGAEAYKLAYWLQQRACSCNRVSYHCQVADQKGTHLYRPILVQAEHTVLAIDRSGADCWSSPGTSTTQGQCCK